MPRAGLFLAIVPLALCHASAPDCAECHAGIAANYAQTGMGRSFHSVGPGSKRPEFNGATFDHEASHQQLTAFEREGRYFVRRSQHGPASQPVNVFEERVDYAIGSGNHAISYLHRRKDDKLVEFPLTWYAENGGHWGMSPGYDRAGHPGFSRAIAFRCMFCHNGYPQLAPGTADWDGASAFPANLPDGIDCQRCHGPGVKHIEAAHLRRPLTEIRAAIVNPAKLPAERKLEVCLQCHLETTSLPLPGAIARFDRGVFSYKPGEPLGDYMLYFDHASGMGHEDKFELVSAAYRLRQSKCFTASEGRLTCTSCHDPHTAPSPAAALARTNGVCTGCHAAIAREAAHPDNRDCVSCHMPRRPAADAIHIAITDHRIVRQFSAPSQPVAEEHDGNVLPYAGAITPYYPPQADPVYTAIAQVKEFARVPTGLRTLEQLIAREQPASSAVYFEMAEALSGAGQMGRALGFYQKALARAPDNWRYLYGMARASGATGQSQASLPELERAVRLARRETSVLQALGSAYAASQRLPEAVGAFRKAIRLDPEDAASFNNLGSALLRLGDAPGAEAALREAVRLQPEIAAMRTSLAQLMAQNGKLREAVFELREAIHNGPSTETARAAWIVALARTGNVEAARVNYQRSLQTQSSGAHNNLGTVYIALGDTTAAIGEYRLAAAADPASVTALLNLGFTLAQYGDAVEARQRLSQALRADAAVKADLERAAQSNDPRVSAAAKEVLAARPAQ